MVTKRLGPATLHTARSSSHYRPSRCLRVFIHRKKVYQAPNGIPGLWSHHIPPLQNCLKLFQDHMFFRGSGGCNLAVYLGRRDLVHAFIPSLADTLCSPASHHQKKRREPFPHPHQLASLNLLIVSAPAATSFDNPSCTTSSLLFPLYAFP
jgi:hypothetical protein